MQMHQEQARGIPLLWCEPEARTEVRQLVIWLPGFAGSKEAMIPYLQDLAEVGFVGASFDPFQHGARRIESQEHLQSRVVGNIRRWFWPILHQTAREVSQVLDWSAAHLQVEPTCGLGGISMGGDIAVAAAGMDHRLAAVAAGIATPDWLRPGSHEPTGEPDESAWQAYHAANPLTHIARYSHAPAIAFDCGADDTQVPPEGAQRFARLLADVYADQPLKMRVSLHEGVAHRYTPEMWANARAWFKTHLGTTGLSP